MNFIVGGALALIIFMVGILSFGQRGSRDSEVAKQLVTDFGRTMGSVSLESSTASATLKSAYGEYVLPALLTMWQQDPSQAPGKSSLGSLPERIDVTSVTPQGNGFIVHGEIVFVVGSEASSYGALAPAPIIVQIVKDEDGNWKIAAFEIQER